MTKSVLFDILIIETRDIKFFNGGAGHDKRNALIYIMCRRGAARTEKEKVKSRYEKIILSEKPFLLYKTS